METVAERLATVRAAIKGAAGRCGRDPHGITLLAVSKGQPAAKIGEAIAAGQTIFGENYVQELSAKRHSLDLISQAHSPVVEWRFTGHLQRNKVKEVVPLVTWIETVDSLRLAEAVQAKAGRPINCCIEVNIGNDAAKRGVRPEAVRILVSAVAELPLLKLRGLMCIPPFCADPEASRPHFRRLAGLLAEINMAKVYPSPLTELSMGMTNDFEVAIEEGATIVRVGTGIFGERQ
ncbi:MAG: YggS family pyridoxal phosphate-dependent enzyme [Deltaproteobacteria bacterium]|nr:YggS family pyridoxal phosphate-dependent enzyme [Deltaproteobacteria bacterium]